MWEDLLERKKGASDPISKVVEISCLPLRQPLANITSADDAPKVSIHTDRLTPLHAVMMERSTFKLFTHGVMRVRQPRKTQKEIPMGLIEI